MQNVSSTMNLPQQGVPNHGQQLRLWPGVAIVILTLLARYGLPVVAPEKNLFGVLALPIGSLAVLLWWLLFSRAPWTERVAAPVLSVAVMFATYRVLDRSIATGAQHMLYAILAISFWGIAFVAWAVATHRLSDGVRWATMVATIFAACGGWALARTGGFTAADLHHDLHWRWTKTPEERLVAESPLPAPAPPVTAAAPEESPAPEKPAKSATKPAELTATPAAAATGADWPGFRGPYRDGAAPGVQIQTDWTASPPVAIWRRAVGPGWSSFAVRGDRIYTQEQRGPDEVVACYKLSSGEPVWAHRDTARFWESNGGPGPRGTPTISNAGGKARVYTFGATGVVNALNASDGALVWSRNAATDAAMKTPDWGFASSPLVVGDQVIVGVSGRLAAYDLATGAPRWMGPVHGTSYSSPVLMTVDGVSQVMLLSAAGATSVALADGALLWEHAWAGYPIVQPALTADGDVLMSVADSSGIRRIGIAHEGGAHEAGWSVKERWTSMGLKPYFNDFVVHKGYAYGFDGSILSCIDLKDGQRKWKGGRFGNGQLVLLPDQDMLLLVSEEGDLALVRAMPDQFTEVARVPAVEGKTWNHPALAGDILLVRNGTEMVAFRLRRL
jgi:outer membrane protein assembly factor BamB